MGGVSIILMASDKTSSAEVSTKILAIISLTYRQYYLHIHATPKHTIKYLFSITGVESWKQKGVRQDEMGLAVLGASVNQILHKSLFCLR